MLHAWRVGTDALGEAERIVRECGTEGGDGGKAGVVGGEGGEARGMGGIGPERR